MRSYEEALLREVIALEVRTYYSYHPSPSELVLREGLSDFLDKVKGFASNMSQKFSDGWEAVTSTVKGMLDTIKEAAVEKLKAAFEKLKELYQSVKEKLGAFFSSPDVKGFAGKYLKDELKLATEIKAATEEDGAPCAGAAVKSMGEKAKAADSGIKEGLIPRGADHRAIALLEADIRLSGLDRRQRLNEGILPDPVNTFLLVIGGLPLLFKGLEKAFEYLANKSCAAWAKKAQKLSNSLYKYFHHKEESFIDLIPNTMAVAFYSTYIKAGGDPFAEEKSGAVVQESMQLSEFFFGKKKDLDAAPKSDDKKPSKAERVGKFGSSTSVSVQTLESNKPLRMKIKSAMYHFLVMFLLFEGLYTLFKKGFSAFYAFKSSVKSAELGATRGAEAAAELGFAGLAAKSAR